MSFITVRYGQNEEKILNPNCLSSVLLSHIKKNCGYESLPEPIDLCSAETGEVVDLLSKPKEYAKKYLEPRGTYVLLKVIGDDSEESTPTFISLLESSNLKISTNPSKARIKKTKMNSSKTDNSDSSKNNEYDSISPRRTGLPPLSAGLRNSKADLNLKSPNERKMGSPKKKTK